MKLTNKRAAFFIVCNLILCFDKMKEHFTFRYCSLALENVRDFVWNSLECFSRLFVCVVPMCNMQCFAKLPWLHCTHAVHMVRHTHLYLWIVWRWRHIHNFSALILPHPLSRSITIYFYTLFAHNGTCLSGILQTSSTYPDIVIGVELLPLPPLMLPRCAFDIAN